jgi:hypothetical protein
MTKQERQDVGQALVNTQEAQSAISQAFDLSSDLPDVEKETEETNYDLTSDYWTPEKEGESKILLFWEFRTRDVQDINDPDVITELECAYFIEQKKGGTTQAICNGSKRLVGTLKEVSPAAGTPFKIVYMGKKKNKNNNFSSDTWRIIPLRIKSK